jgi:acyl carrier protein
MNSSGTLEGIAAIISRQFQTPLSSVTRETSAYDVDGWDSVSHVYIILEVERVFQVTLPEVRVFQLENVGELADLVAELCDD